MNNYITITFWHLRKWDTGKTVRHLEIIKAISASPKRNGEMLITLPNLQQITIPIEDVISISTL